MKKKWVATKPAWEVTKLTQKAEASSSDWQQKSAGKEILQMLHKPAEPERTAGKDILNMVKNKKPEVQVRVKGTFIDAQVREHPGRTRPRVQTDSILYAPKEQFLPEGLPLCNSSDRSTEVPADLEEYTHATSSRCDPYASMNAMQMFNSPGASPMPYNMADPFLDCADQSWMLPMAFDPSMAWYDPMMQVAQWEAHCQAACSSGMYDGHMKHADGGYSDNANFMYTIEETPAELPKTTVMLRNIPTAYTRSQLLEILEDEGFAGSFDFVYCPMDFSSKCCLGYAFVNFVSASDALRCRKVFEGFNEWGTPSEKVCEVTWGEPLQGLQAHIERYRNSPVMHSSVPEDWKPLIFQKGSPVDFPPPTKTIKAPKLRSK